MTQNTDRPLETAELETALSCFKPYSRLLLAVSGGPDSLALMLCTARFSTLSLHVATVDHGLRLGSGEEAEQVGEWAKALGLTHTILHWRAPRKPASAVQEQARDARYGLLIEHARHVGASALVTAHHADDQAETVLQRLTHGSGIDGLAGMASIAQRGDIALLRPFLSFPKARLIATLQAHSHPFLDDPSNHDPRHQRSRLRRIMPLLADDGLTPERLGVLARRAGMVREALEWQAQRLWPEIVHEDTGESVCFAVGLWDCPAEIRRRLVLMALQRLNASTTPIRLERQERALERLFAAWLAKRSERLTLGGVMLTLSRDGRLTLAQAPARQVDKP